jgi:hypothetical protein
MSPFLRDAPKAKPIEPLPEFIFSSKHIPCGVGIYWLGYKWIVLAVLPVSVLQIFGSAKAIAITRLATKIDESDRGATNSRHLQTPFSVDV